MLTSTALPVRAASVANAALRPRYLSANFVPCVNTASYSTKAPQRSSSIALQPSHQTKRTPSLTITVRPQLAQPSRTAPLVRHSSTQSAAANATASPTASSTTPPSPDGTLTWNRFLAMRKTRRRISLLSSVLAAIASTAGGTYFVLSMNLDSVGATTFGLDPLIVMGLSVIGTGCVGWLLGPALGDAVFRLWYRRIGSQIAVKEKAFLHRIKTFRVDPAQSSYTNPVPDFYGEKIGSVADYRRWLKDQRAYNLKTSGTPRGGAGAVALGKRRKAI
ncbi:presequence translocated-associated motor subunit pam-17 [Phyllosticta citribraziliensis]|uniref:Presequence translocated-associated motor subunit PAM17 n=1 Tax=Phyllosticta citribraziliensis TaxID=989973 RepID=A0ABR1M472_9PEZI